MANKLGLAKGTTKSNELLKLTKEETRMAKNNIKSMIKNIHQ